MTASTETLDAIPDSAPQALPYHSNASPLRSADSPKREAAEMYLKSKALLESRQPHTKDIDVFLKRDIETGFGFRVLGGEGPQQPNIFPQVYIGAIVPNGAAEKDGRLRAGDELIGIDGVMVKGRSHKQVLDLMTNAARNGQVMLTVRRKVVYRDATEEEALEMAPVLVNGSPKLPRLPMPGALDHESFDITLHRRDSEGFGFVILTSKSKPPYGVIPHKIGRIIAGSPTDRCGLLHVGDRISAVNGRSIVELSHNDIVQLIKEAGTVVTLTVVPEDEYKGPPSGASSAKQSPAPQHRAIGPRSTLQDERYSMELEEKREGVDWSEPRSLSLSEQGTMCVTGPNQGCLTVELERGPRGFGFSLRGGTEYNMGLYILRLAEDGAAQLDGRIHVGDEIVEINGEPARGISHTRAIELIQAGGSKVVVLLRPGAGLAQDAGRRDRKLISPTGNSGEVFLSNPSSAHPTGASISARSPFSGKLKHSHSCSNISAPGARQRSASSGALRCVQERAAALSPASPEHATFCKRTRPLKDPREQSSPKRTGEMFPQSKEQHRGPTRADGPPPRGGRRAASTPQLAEPRGEKASCPGGAGVEARRYSQRREAEGRVEQGRPVREQQQKKESFKRRVEGRSQTLRSPPRAGGEGETERGPGKEAGQRGAGGRNGSTEERSAGKEGVKKRESLLSFKGMWSRRSSVVSPREAGGGDDPLSPSKGDSPGAAQSQKRPVNPGPWKVPSSARILSREEVLRDPCGFSAAP